MLLYRPIKRQQILPLQHLKDGLRTQKLLQRALERSHMLAVNGTIGKHFVHTVQATDKFLEHVQRLASEIVFKLLTVWIIWNAAPQIR